MLFKLIKAEDVSETVCRFTTFGSNLSQIILHTAHKTVKQTIVLHRTQLNSMVNPLICIRLSSEELHQNIRRQSVMTPLSEDLQNVAKLP